MPQGLTVARRPDCPRRLVRSASQALLLAVLLVCPGLSLPNARAADIGVRPLPSGAPGAVPLGMERGASRKAWAAAAALSRGINLAVYAAPREGDWGLHMDEQWIETLAQAGFRSVRVSVRWSNHASADAKALLDEAFARRIDRVVDALLARGLHVVLNMSFYSQLNGWPLEKGESAVAAADVRPRFVSLWRQLARRHAHRPDRLLFELYNAPQGSALEWNRLAAVTVAAIRQSNPARVIAIAPIGSEVANLAQLVLPGDPHIMATVHHREPRAFTGQGLPWVEGSQAWLGTTCCDDGQRLQLERSLDRAREWSARQRYPVWLGSFGAASMAPMDSRARYLRLVRDAAEARGMPWAHADFAANFNVREPPLDSGIYDVVNRRWHRSLRDALLGP